MHAADEKRREERAHERRGHVLLRIEDVALRAEEGVAFAPVVAETVHSSSSYAALTARQMATTMK